MTDAAGMIACDAGIYVAAATTVKLSCLLSYREPSCHFLTGAIFTGIAFSASRQDAITAQVLQESPAKHHAQQEQLLGPVTMHDIAEQ